MTRIQTNLLLSLAILGIGFFLFGTLQNAFALGPAGLTDSDTKQTIPSWFKNNAKWFHDGLISENEIISGIENLIDQNIIIVKPTSHSNQNKGDAKIPSYIKDVFGFWSEDKVSDAEIANSLQYLIGQGIIKSKKISENQQSFDNSEDEVNCGGDDQPTGPFNSTPLSEKDKKQYKKIEDKITILKQPTKMTCAPTVAAMMILHKNSTVSPGVYKGSTQDLIDSLKKSMGTDEEKGSKPNNIANGIGKWLKGKDNGKNLKVKYISESSKDGDLLDSIEFKKIKEITATELLAELNNGENIMVMAQDDKGNKHALYIIGAGDKPDEDGKISIAYVDPRRGMVQGKMGEYNVIIDEVNDENWDPLAKVSIIPTEQAQNVEHAMNLDKNQAAQGAAILVAHEKATEIFLQIANHNFKMYSDLANESWDSYNSSKDDKTMQQATSYETSSKTWELDAKTTVNILKSARNQVKSFEDTFDVSEISGTPLGTLSGFNIDEIKTWDDLLKAYKKAQEALKIGHKIYQNLVFGVDTRFSQTVLINSDKEFWSKVCANPEELSDLPFSNLIGVGSLDFEDRCWAYQIIYHGPPKLNGTSYLPPTESTPSEPTNTISPLFTISPTTFSWIHTIGTTNCPQDVTTLILNPSGSGTVNIITKPSYLDVKISGNNGDVNFNCILTQYNSQTLSGQLVFTFTGINGTSNPVSIPFTGQINKP